VAENKKKGDIGTKQREGEAQVETARIDAENVKSKNMRLQEVERSNNELMMVKYAFQTLPTLLNE
jgi:hypothetical protein